MLAVNKSQTIFYLAMRAGRNVRGKEKIVKCPRCGRNGWQHWIGIDKQRILVLTHKRTETNVANLFIEITAADECWIRPSEPGYRAAKEQE